MYRSTGRHRTWLCTSAVEMKWLQADAETRNTTQATSVANHPLHVTHSERQTKSIKTKAICRPRSAMPFFFFYFLSCFWCCCTKGTSQRNSLQSGISAIRGDMELICLIKCLTELAFGVQREFKQKGRDWIRAVVGEKRWQIVAAEGYKETKGGRAVGER